MKIDDLIKRIQEERVQATEEAYSADGLARLQEVAAAYKGEYRLVESEKLIEEIKKRPTKKLHPTGISSVDMVLGGFREQQLIGIAAHSAHGKTAMGLYLIELFKELNPVMIPLEQSNEELIEQRLDNGHSIPHFLSPLKTASRVSTDWIEERVVEGIAKFNSKLVVIDHLGYVDAKDKYDSDGEHLRIERKLQDIKNIAKRWNVIIITLIHITQVDEGIPPSLHNLKGSSAIRQECDTIILLWRKNALKRKIRVYDDKTLLSVQKNRRTGQNGNVGLCFNRKTGRYEEDNRWVESMEASARQATATEDEFNEI